MKLTENAFYTMVREMRRLQNEYFRIRSPYILKECKKAEKNVDDAIGRFQFAPEQKTPNQVKMF